MVSARSDGDDGKESQEKARDAAGDDAKESQEKARDALLEFIKTQRNEMYRFYYKRTNSPNSNRVDKNQQAGDESDGRNITKVKIQFHVVSPN